MERSVIATCLVAGGILIAQILPKEAARIAANRKPASHYNARIQADTVKPAIKIYKPSDFDDGSTVSMTDTKNGRTEKALLFKRNGVLYQMNMKHGEVTSFYVNGDQKPVSQYQDKIDELMDEYRDITPPPVPPVPPRAVAMAAPAAPAIAGVAMAAPTPPSPVVAGLPAMAPVPPVAPINNKQYAAVTTELINEGVIKDKDNFDVSINNKYLKVDGVTQSEELHQKMLKKLNVKKGDNFSWSFSNHQ